MLKHSLRVAAAVFLLTAAASSTLAEEKAPTTERPRFGDKISETEKFELNGADTAWMLVCTGLVMVMVPGLALFYGGMARRKNILGTMMQSMAALGLVGVLWVVVGYALAFG